MHFYNNNNNNNNNNNKINISFPTTSASTFVQQEILSNATNSSVLPECFFQSTLKSPILNFCAVAIASTLTITANVLFCFAVYKKPRLHNPSMILSVNFYITWIITSLINPFIMISPDWPTGLIGKIDIDAFNALWSFAIVAPFATLTAMAFERYFVTNRRSFYKMIRTLFTMQRRI